MNVIRSLIINNIDSYKDFGIFIKEKNISSLEKVENRKTVPGMHGSYDFSSIFGEPIYSDRTITYTFDINDISFEDLDKCRRDIFDWLINVNNTKIYDSEDEEHYWLGSYQSGSFQEDYLKGVITVSFIVYPFAISKYPRILKYKGTGNITKTCKIANKGSHRILPIITTTDSITITSGNKRYSFSKGSFEDHELYLERGNNDFAIIHTTDSSFELEFRYYEEVA